MTYDEGEETTDTTALSCPHVITLYLTLAFLGFPFAFGVFEKYYTTHELFASSAASIPAIGTTATGIMYFASPPFLYLMTRFPQYVRPMCATGLGLLLAGLIGASFANTVWQLILTQGVLYGLGGGLHYFPAIIYLDDWFVTRKGLAYGIMWAGTGTGGILVPIVMEAVLARWEFRTALRSWAMFSVSTPTRLQFLDHDH